MIRATTAPRSVPAPSVRSTFTKPAAPAESLLRIELPVVPSGAGGASFGTMVRRSRLSAAGLGTPVAAKASSGFSAAASGASDFAVDSAAA